MLHQKVASFAPKPSLKLTEDRSRHHHGHNIVHGSMSTRSVYHYRKLKADRQQHCWRLHLLLNQILIAPERSTAPVISRAPVMAAPSRGHVAAAPTSTVSLPAPAFTTISEMYYLSSASLHQHQSESQGSGSFSCHVTGHCGCVKRSTS